MFNTRRTITRKYQEFGDSITEQHHKDGVDINNLVQKFARIGMPQPPRPEDFKVAPVGDYHEMMNALAKTEQSFMQLPSKVRKEFDNDVQAFINHISVDENLKSMLDSGILGNTPPEVSVEASAPQVDPTPTE